MSSDTNAAGGLGEPTAEMGLGGDEEAALKRVRMVSNLLDDAVPVPGTEYRVGVDPLLGILPGAGDSVSALISLYIVLEAANMDVPPDVLVRMLANVAIDTAAGSVPAVGVLFDASWKANKRNVRLLERHLEKRTGDV